MVWIKYVSSKVTQAGGRRAWVVRVGVASGTGSRKATPPPSTPQAAGVVAEEDRAALCPTW